MLKIIRVVMKTMIVMFLLLFSKVSIAEPDWQVLPDKINKSEGDTIQYQAIKLSNEMIVLLASDPKAVKSLVAVTVAVGSMCDPDQQLGLAHYLEHMIFNGSKRYPESNEISKFLGKHGGRFSAHTAFNHTPYFLEVSNGNLKAATDRLANALSEPLFDPIKADQERNIVNSEATMYRSDDAFRLNQVRSETLNSGHPNSRFRVGNLETLGDKPDSNLHSELKKFHHRYYSANLMKGFLYGKESLSQLAKIAAETFGRIPNRKASVPAITVPAMTDKEKGIIVHYVPAQPQKSLLLEFSIANNLTEFRSKTDAYIQYLIENQSHNTLADWLLNNSFATGINAVTHPDIDGNSGSFMIHMTLTDKGLEHRDKIIAAVFSYIDLLKKGGINSNYFNEMARNINMLYHSDVTVRDMVYGSQLSIKMLNFPIANVLDAYYIADRFNSQAISSRLSELTPRNARICFIGPNEPHNKVAYAFDAPYQVDKINPQQYRRWEDLQKTIKFSLPELNPYVANDFSLIKSSRHYQHPELVYDGGNYQVFYMPSQYFADKPLGRIVLNLLSEQSNKTVKSQVSESLLQYLASLKISQLKYQASVAGMYIGLFSNSGLQFIANGYTQHLPELMIKVVKEYLAFTISEEEVAQAKLWYREKFEVNDNLKAHVLAIYPLKLGKVPYERDQLLKELETITANDILKYRKDTIENATLKAIVFGNLTPKQGIDTVKSVCNLLNNKGKKWVKNDIVAIDKEYKVNFEYQANSTDNALAEIFIPIGYDRNKGFVLSNILANILSGWFSEQLRMQEQLGYAVFASQTSIGEQYGLYFVLQSNNKTPAYLHTRYQNFYQLAFKKLKAMPKKEFEKYRRMLLNGFKKPPQSFYEEIDRFMSAYLRKDDVNFDDRKKIINELTTVTQQDLLTFYSNAVLQKKGLAIVSQVIAKGVNKDGYVQLKDWTTYPTISELQKILLREEK